MPKSKDQKYVKRGQETTKDVVIFDFDQKKELRRCKTLGKVVDNLERIKKTFEGDENIGKMNKSIEYINNSVECVKKIEGKIENLSKKLSKDITAEEQQEFIQKLTENKEDPLENLKDIPDKEIREVVTKIILQNSVVRKYMVLLLSEQQVDTKEKLLKQIADNSYDIVIKGLVKDFLDGIESMRKRGGMTIDNLKDLVSKFSKIEERKKEELDLNVIFENNIGLKEGLKKEIKENVKKEEIDENEDDNIFENDDTEIVSYEKIKSFYNKYLHNDNTNMYIKREELDELIQEFDSFLDGKGDKELSNIRKFVEILKSEQSKKGNQVEIIEDKKEEKVPHFSMEKLLTASLVKPSENKDKPQGGFWESAWAVGKLGLINFCFSAIISAFTMPVTFAILMSQLRIDQKGKGFTFNTKGFEDLKPVTPFKEEKK